MGLFLDLGITFISTVFGTSGKSSSSVINSLFGTDIRRLIFGLGASCNLAIVKLLSDFLLPESIPYNLEVLSEQ